MRAGLIGTDAYLAEWRREPRECGDDLEAEVGEEAAWLEAAYPDDTLERHGVERLPGDHCYGFLAGNAAWEQLHDVEPATFYLTNFLARHFDAIVIRGLGLDRHPELLSQYFGNYKRLLYLAQTDNEDLRSRARAAARRLDLEYVEQRTGYGDLVPSLTRFVEAPEAA